LARANESEVGDRPARRAIGAESVVGNFLPRGREPGSRFIGWTRGTCEHWGGRCQPGRSGCVSVEKRFSGGVNDKAAVHDTFAW